MAKTAGRRHHRAYQAHLIAVTRWGYVCPGQAARATTYDGQLDPPDVRSVHKGR